MRESRTYGSVRGALSNGRPYRVPASICRLMAHRVNSRQRRASVARREAKRAFEPRSRIRAAASLKLRGLIQARLGLSSSAANHLQPNRVNARPAALAISLPVHSLAASASAASAPRLALALLGLGDLPPVVLQNAAVTLLDVRALGRFADDERVRAVSWRDLERHVRLRRRPQQLAWFVQVRES